MPSEMDEIFGKAGSSWTDDEYNRVWEWLHEYPQLRRLLLLAKHWLGSWATIEDAEEVWGRFNLYPSSRSEGIWIFTFRRVVNSYDPEVENGRSFWNYLLFCFKMFCLREAERKGPQNPGSPIMDEDGEPVEIDFPDNSNNPQNGAEDEERNRLLKECINQLPPDYREVILLHYFEEMSIAEIALSLGISESLVKVRLFRARQDLLEKMSVAKIAKVLGISEDLARQKLKEMSVAKIAKVLGISEDLVTVRLLRVPQNIKELFLS